MSSSPSRTHQPCQSGSRRVAASVAALTTVLFAVACRPSGAEEGLPAGNPPTFQAGSVWTAPLPPGVPLHPRSDQILDFLRETNAADGCVLLAGAETDPWGAPVYWAGPDDPLYDVASTRYVLPPEFSDLRIPEGARPADNADAEMVVYDVRRGIVAHLSKARFDEGAGKWTAGGGSVAYFASNGLDSRLEGSVEPRNTGSFRGYNGFVAVVRLAEVESGSVDRVMKVGVAESNRDAVWPMAGSDGDSTSEDAPMQGVRIRIKPERDLDRYGLHPQALAVARGLQTHGAIIADSTGGGITLMLEDTRIRTGSQEWELETSSLCVIPIDDFEVIQPGFDPNAAG